MGGLGDLPEGLGLVGGGVEGEVQGLGALSMRGVDEEDLGGARIRPTSSPRAGGGAGFEMPAVAAVIPDPCGSKIHFAPPDTCTCSRIERVPVPSETTAFRAFDSA